MDRLFFKANNGLEKVYRLLNYDCKHQIKPKISVLENINSESCHGKFKFIVFKVNGLIFTYRVFLPEKY